MKTVATLIITDCIAIKRWFATQTASKLLVLLGFFFVFASVSIGIFLFGLAFFHSLALSDIYGFLTASYMIHAGIVMILLLAIVSSIASITTFLFTQNKQVDFLITLPLKAANITLWFFVKSIIYNLILLLIPFLPVALSFQIVFRHTIPLSFLIRVSLVLFLLVLLANSVGGIIGYYIAKMLKRNGLLTVAAGVILFFLIGTAILRLIFPSSLFALYSASPEEFFNLYNRLPLVSPFLPTTWLTQTILSGISINFLYAAILALLLSFWANSVIARRFIPLFQALKTDTHLKNPSITSFAASRRPLLYKDWLSIIRLPQEVGYGLFLLSMAVFFFLLISYANKTAESSINKMENEIILFSFVWLLFFAICYLLRLVFPLVAREIEAAWYIFTLPISRLKILTSKIAIGLLLATPLMSLSIITWFLMPFQKEKILLVASSIWGIFLLAISHTLLGAIFPNFELGRDPEKVSTSAMGIITLIVSVIIVSVIVFTLYWFLKNAITIWSVISIFFAFSIVLSSLLFLVSNYSIKRYEF